MGRWCRRPCRVVHLCALRCHGLASVKRHHFVKPAISVSWVALCLHMSKLPSHTTPQTVSSCRPAQLIQSEVTRPTSFKSRQTTQIVSKAGPSQTAKSSEDCANHVANWVCSPAPNCEVGLNSWGPMSPTVSVCSSFKTSTILWQQPDSAASLPVVVRV